MERKLLIIGFVWPEPNSTGSGVRMMQLIQFFLDKEYEITFASTASKTNYMVSLEKLGVLSQEIELNNSSFDSFVKNLNPNVVMFDRYLTEEQFGWRVTEQVPNAVKVLDTEDLHFLRKERKEAFKEKRALVSENLWNSDLSKREIASIYRCDISLIISKYEMELLKFTFNISNNLLHYLPFLEEEIKENNTPTFEGRKGFVFIGNFRHEPNWNCVQYLKESVWPLIRQKLPKAELNIYGSYPPAKAMQLNKPQEGFNIKGWADSADEVMQNARICLAPLRFGAGIKGKFIDAMRNGCPVATTKIGAEGIKEIIWNGVEEDDLETFVDQVVDLYTIKEKWNLSQENGFEIINVQFNKKQFLNEFEVRFEKLLGSIGEHRNQSFIGKMLTHQSMQSTKYMSKWIEEKNKA